MILNEKELIQRCLRKDRHAQEFLFSEFYDELYIIARRYMSDHHDAEDVIIQSFIRVFKSLDNFTFTGQGSLGKWIRTILINESIRNLKKRSLLNYNDDIIHLESHYSEANALHQMQAADIIRMIDNLPIGYRTVFNLFVVEGYSHKEIGQKLGISENTSKTQLKKARHQLMTIINEERRYGTV